MVKAEKIVHTPTGPEPCCASHALKLIGLMRFLGAHVGVTDATGDEECRNCKNESAKEDRNA